MNKKAFTGIIKLVILAIVVTLLFYLIKNGWDVNKAFADMADLFRVGQKA